MSKSSCLRNGYSKVARVLGKGDPKKQDLPMVEDHPAGQQHAQETVETYGTVTNNIKRLIKEFRIYRWSPDNPYQKPYLHSYFIDLSKCGAPGLAVENDYRYVGVYKVLDVLQKIKAEDDSTLVMQGSEGICGSCAMNVDGTNTVACLKPVDAATSEAIRDLVVDLTIFYMQYNASCLSYWWNPEEFLGPSPLLQAFRWICDSRDEFADERLQALTEDHKRLYRCRTMKNCTAICPQKPKSCRCYSQDED